MYVYVCVCVCVCVSIYTYVSIWSVGFFFQAYVHFIQPGINGSDDSGGELYSNSRTHTHARTLARFARSHTYFTKFQVDSSGFISYNVVFFLFTYGLKGYRSISSQHNRKQIRHA
nr:hypothetical protein [Oryctes rhinoceros nudivirus]